MRWQLGNSLNNSADDGRLESPAVAMRKGYTHNGLRQQIRIFEQLRQRRSSRSASTRYFTRNYNDGIVHRFSNADLWKKSK